MTEAITFNFYEQEGYKIAPIKFSVMAVPFELAIDPYTYRAFLHILRSSGGYRSAGEFITERTTDTWGFKSSGRPMLTAQTLQTAIIDACAKFVTEQ